MIARVLGMLLLGATLVSAAEDHLETCIRFEWDYEPPDVNLVMFHLFVRAASDPYDFTKLPIAIAPGIPTMVLEIPCRVVRVSKPGKYFAVVKAVGLDGAVSDPSNEISFLYGTADEITPPAPKPPPAPSPTPPPEFYVPPPLMPDPRPPPPRTGSRPGGITDSCVWRGVPCE